MRNVRVQGREVAARGGTVKTGRYWYGTVVYVAVLRVALTFLVHWCHNVGMRRLTMRVGA